MYCRLKFYPDYKSHLLNNNKKGVLPGLGFVNLYYKTRKTWIGIFAMCYPRSNFYSNKKVRVKFNSTIHAAHECVSDNLFGANKNQDGFRRARLERRPIHTRLTTLRCEGDAGLVVVLRVDEMLDHLVAPLHVGAQRPQSFQEIGHVHQMAGPWFVLRPRFT